MKTLVLLFFSFASLAQCANIITQPLAQITCEGDSIRLFCLSSGGSYQWEKRRPSDSKFTSITNIRSSHFAFLSGGTAHPSGGYYRVKIALGKCIIYSDSVLIILQKAPVISALTVCEKVRVPLYPFFRWSINGQTVDSIIASPTSNGSKLKAYAQFSTLPAGTCILPSNEVTLTVTSLPAAPVHALKLIKACVGLPYSLNATGCSPALTFWYDVSGRKIGEGSRQSLISRDSSIYRASCVKSGCEGPLSTGVKTAIAPIPEPPLNTSSPFYCSGVTFSLQASGGLNNIWYESESAKSSLSTATALAMKAIIVTSNTDSLLVRFATAKINDCESARTPIIFRIKPRLQLEPFHPFSITGERTIAIPQTIIKQATKPIKISITSTAKNPMGPFSANGFIFRTVTDSLGCRIQDTTQVSYSKNGPIVHHLNIHTEINCLKSNYLITIQGCPLKTSALSSEKRYESTTAEFILTGGMYYFLCNDGQTDTLSLKLPQLKKPNSTIRTSFNGVICETDSADIRLEIDPSTHFIGWEKEGHLISEHKMINGILPAGEYQSVIEENGCFYRSEKILLIRRPNPPTPILEKLGAYFLEVKSVGTPDWLIDQKPSTDTSTIKKITEGKEFYARTKSLYKSLACFSNYSNVIYSDNPPSYEFTTYPNPTTGRISIEIAYETENSKLVLFDLKGKQLDQMEVENSSRKIDWDLSHIPAGTYVIKLIADGISQERTIRKFL